MLAVLGCALVLAPRVEAQEAQPEARIVSCASGEELEDAVRQAVGVSEDTPVTVRWRGGALPVQTDAGGRYTLDVDIGTGSGRIHVHERGESCEEVLAALFRRTWDCPRMDELESPVLERLRARDRSVDASMSIDRDAGGPYVLLLDVRSPQPSFRVRQESRSCRALFDLALRLAEHPPPRWILDVLFTGYVDVGSTLAATAGGRVGVRLRYDAFSLMLALDAMVPQTGAIAGTRAQVSSMPISVALLGCGRAADGVVSLDLCGGFLAGAQLVRFDIDTRDQAAFVPALSGGAILGVPLIGTFQVIFTADLVVPLIRPELVAAGATITASEPVAGRFGVGLLGGF